MRRAAAALLLVLATACGTTVPLSQQVSAGGSGTGTGGLDAGQSTGGLPVPGATSTTGGAGTSGGTSAVPGGGGSSSTGGGSGGAAPSGAGPASTRQPIKIGFVTTSVGNAQSLGVNAGQTYSDRAMYDALVQDYNSRGGLNGHRIVPVYGNTDTASADWSNQFAQVCATFTQDNKVQAVIGYIFVFLDSFENCLAKANVPHLYAGYQPGDVEDQRRYPTLVSTAHPTVDGANLVPLEGALASGLLTTKTKLGLLIDDCANGFRAFSRSTEPWLKARGINYQVVKMSCAQGSGDVGAAASAVSSAELAFASSGVDLVYSSGVALLVFMSNAESQNYRPQYLTSIGGAALEPNAPQEQMKNLHGFGWMPSMDTNQAQQPYPRTPAQTACLARLARRGLRPAAYNDFMAAYATCDGLELYARALARTGGATEPLAIVNGVVSSLPAFVGAATYGGGLKATPRQRGGPSTYRETGWTSSCSCMTYRGPTRAVPTP